MLKVESQVHPTPVMEMFEKNFIPSIFEIYHQAMLLDELSLTLKSGQLYKRFIINEYQINASLTDVKTTFPK